MQNICKKTIHQVLRVPFFGPYFYIDKLYIKVWPKKNGARWGVTPWKKLRISHVECTKKCHLKPDEQGGVGGLPPGKKLRDLHVEWQKSGLFKLKNKVVDVDI